MQSLIIVGPNQKIKEKALEICGENKISEVDVSTLGFEKQIGIEDIRNLQRGIFLKPLKGDKKAVILEAYLGITNDAQNSFLKTLEEPPESTIIMVLVNSIDFLLPTVISRCKIISVEKNPTLENELKDKYKKILQSVNADKTGNGMIVAQDYGKNKEEALKLLKNLIVVAHEDLNKENAKVLKKLQKTYTLIKTTNTSVRLALENLFLNL